MKNFLLPTRTFLYFSEHEAPMCAWVMEQVINHTQQVYLSYRSGFIVDDMLHRSWNMYRPGFDNVDKPH